MFRCISEVRFDFEKNTLSLTYQKDYTDGNSQCSDIKQLSGGERSFATLALLLALGKSHECPFRWAVSQLGCHSS